MEVSSPFHFADVILGNVISCCRWCFSRYPLEWVCCSHFTCRKQAKEQCVAVCPMAEVGLGPRTEGCVGWAGGVYSTQQQELLTSESYQ